MPLISVITAALNACDDLEWTVASVKHQTLTCEHIVVDGGSDDRTTDFLDSQGVKYVSEPDGGIADAMNKGIAMATGDYVIALHAGDRFLAVDSAALAARYLTHDMASFSVVAGDRVIEAGPLRLKTEFFMTVPHQGLFIKRELFETIGAYDTFYKIGMDYDFMIRAMRAGKELRWVNMPLTYMQPGGVSSSRSWPDVKQRITEFNHARMRHCTGTVQRLVLSAFWLAYLPFKYLRHVKPITR